MDVVDKDSVVLNGMLRYEASWTVWIKWMIEKRSHAM